MRFKMVLVFLGAAALAVSASAQTKVSGKTQCKQEPPTPVEVGDRAGHAFAVGKSACTWTGFEIGGDAYKDGTSVSQDEISRGKVTTNGYHTATLASGDKTTAHFHGSSVMKDGKFVSGSGTWTLSSGTGKYKGIKGKGTYKGTPNADGTVTFDVEGEYTLAK